MSQLVDYFVVCGLHGKSLEKELTTGQSVSRELITWLGSCLLGRVSPWPGGKNNPLVAWTSLYARCVSHVLLCATAMLG